MNAKEAREKATSKLTNENDSQYAKIMADIVKAADSGKFECYVYDDFIKDAVREKLTNLGYTIGNTDSFRNESTTSITW